MILIHFYNNVLPIIIGVLRTVPKGLVRGLEELEIRGLQHY